MHASQLQLILIVGVPFLYCDCIHAVHQCFIQDHFTQNTALAKPGNEHCEDSGLFVYQSPARQDLQHSR